MYLFYGAAWRRRGWDLIQVEVDILSRAQSLRLVGIMIQILAHILTRPARPAAAAEEETTEWAERGGISWGSGGGGGDTGGEKGRARVQIRVRHHKGRGGRRGQSQEKGASMGRTDVCACVWQSNQVDQVVD